MWGTRGESATMVVMPKNSLQIKATPAAQLHFGKVIFPLRVFLGVTYIYAGLLKLTDPNYFSKTAPSGVLHQMQAASAHSPIAFIVNHAIEHSTLAGLGIALGELLAGLGLLVGIWSRIAGLGIFGLAASFFLTVSWGTTPYFFGPDSVFMAAALPFILGGDGGYLSVEAMIRQRVQRDAGVTPGATLSNKPLEDQIQRRTLIQSGAVAGGLGIAGLVVGAIGHKRNTGNITATPTPSATLTSSATPTSSGTAPSGTKVATVADVPVGSAFQFTEPTTGAPAYIMQPKAGTFLAYSAICTHEGCIVNFDKGNNIFACPCHGAQFDTASGAPTRGPAQTPLQKFTITASGTDLYLA